jgi:predicted ester cyclase
VVHEEEDKMSTEANKAIMQRWVEEGFNQGKLDVVDEVVAPDYVLESTTPTEQLPGPEGSKNGILEIRRIFPDLHVTIEDQVAEGGKVVTRYSATGTQMGEFMGIAPTGKQVTMNWLAIDRFEGGKLVRGWDIADYLGLFQQLGAVPKLG